MLAQLIDLEGLVAWYHDTCGANFHQLDRVTLFRLEALEPKPSSEVAPAPITVETPLFTRLICY
jgi:hypothetical protein